MPMNSFSFQRATLDEQDFDLELSGILDCHNLSEFLASKQSKHFQKFDFKPVNLDNLKNHWTDYRGRRIAPRFDLELTALICNHAKAFRSQTKNISLSGLCLCDLLPEDFSQGPFEVVLIEEDESGKKHYLLLRARAVQGKLRSGRIYFESITSYTEKQLFKLLAGLTES